MQQLKIELEYNWDSFKVEECRVKGDNQTFCKKKLEDAKGVIRRHNSKKNRKYNGCQKIKDKKTTNGRQNTTHKTTQLMINKLQLSQD